MGDDRKKRGIQNSGFQKFKNQWLGIGNLESSILNPAPTINYELLTFTHSQRTQLL